MKALKLDGHSCEHDPTLEDRLWSEKQTELHDMHGPAIVSCFETEDGAIWVSNGEYATRVNICPFCGFRASLEIGAELK